MKSRIFALCMVMALLLTCMFAVPAQAAEEGYILNGDFSSWDSVDCPANWPVGNSWRVIRVNKNADNPYMYFTGATSAFSPDIIAKGGETYTLSFRCFTGESGFGLRVWWRFYDAEGHVLNTDKQYEDYLSTEVGAWKTQAKTRTAPENAVKLVLLFNCYSYPTIPDGKNATQMLGFDDLKLTKGTQVLGERVSNSNMEWLQDGMPTNFKVTGTAVLEEETVHSGTKAIEVTGAAADSVTTVSTYFFAEKGTPYYDISAYVNVDSIEEGNGVKMEVYNGTTKISATDYFKAAEKGWIKMMPVRASRYAASTNAVLEIRVTVEGKGTVYLDDFSANGTNNILYNGEFDGFSGDDAHIALIGTSNYNTISLNPDDTAAIYTEENGNKYLYIHSAPKSNQGYPFRGMYETGARYKLSMDVKSPGGWDAYVSVTNAGSGALGATANSGTTWEHYELYFICDNSKGTSGFTFCTLGVRGGVTATSAGGVASYDNVSLVKVSDAATTSICDANGNTVEKGVAGSAYTAKYHGFAEDYTAPEKEPVTLIFALYEKLEDGSVRLDTIKLQKGAPQYIARQENNGAANMREGQLPLDLASDAITIPNDGKSYELRAYTWDDFTNMTPYYASISA